MRSVLWSMGCTVALVVLVAGLAGGAAPAAAVLVYQRGDQVVVAANDGSASRTVATGRHPVVSPDGAWVAYVAPGATRVMLVSSSGGRSVTIARGRTDQLGDTYRR